MNPLLGSRCTHLVRSAAAAAAGGSLFVVVLQQQLSSLYRNEEKKMGHNFDDGYDGGADGNDHCTVEWNAKHGSQRSQYFSLAC